MARAVPLPAVVDLTISDGEEAVDSFEGATGIVNTTTPRRVFTGPTKVNGSGTHLQTLQLGTQRVRPVGRSSASWTERPTKRRRTSEEPETKAGKGSPKNHQVNGHIVNAGKQWRNWHGGRVKASTGSETIDLSEQGADSQVDVQITASTASALDLFRNANVQKDISGPVTSSVVLPSIEGTGLSSRTPLHNGSPMQDTLPTPRSGRQTTRGSDQNASTPGPSRSGHLADATRPNHGGVTKLLSSRPYLLAADRQFLLDNPKYLRWLFDRMPRLSNLHVSFSDLEIEYLQYVARGLYSSKGTTAGTRTTQGDLRHLLKKARKQSKRKEDGWSLILDTHVEEYAKMEQRSPSVLLRRSREDVDNFLKDLLAKDVKDGQQHTWRLHRQDSRSRKPQPNKTARLLFMRETAGARTFGGTRGYENFRTTIKSQKDDTFEPKIEWVDAAGDIFTVSWVSNTDFICGTTTHSDSHNQQYNKPGNLLLGSSRGSGSLRAFSDHRIPRPVVAEGDNALDSMVESQDPWLYSSVVSSDYDPKHNLAFTSSFDHTVKIWRIKEGSMEAVATWLHDGRVNFVLASKHESGMIATAADVITGAVRVYRVDYATLKAQYDSYSCNKVHEEDYVPSDKWAYFPATLRWGVAPAVQHLLLIGYSPRSTTAGHDHEIPEDRLKTGELCVWDALLGKQIKVISGATHNVFEVVWHPSRNCFAAATSKVTDLDRRTEDHVKTQIRIFEPNPEGQYHAIKTLDCPAIDINELTIRPNSAVYFYVAASCTDGKVYVWDTALKDTDEPMCVLKHGEPVEELLGERDQEDVGVKFAAWATTTDRLYTGSSDGVVKVWNIRRGRGAKFVRNLLTADGPITFGAFSPDYTKLVVGDGAGKVYLAALAEDDDDDDVEGEAEKSVKPSTTDITMQVGARQKRIRRPRPITPHQEPPLPPQQADGSSRSILQLGQQRARDYLQRQELVLTGDRRLGAVQGPEYPSTGLFRAEAHFNEDPKEPLLSMFERQQRENNLFSRRRRMARLRHVIDDDYDDDNDDDDDAMDSDLISVHQKNCATDLDISNLDNDTLSAFKAERVEWDPEADYDLDYSESD